MSFRALLWKEIRDLLRDPHILAMLLIPALIYGIMGEATGSAIQQAVQQAKSVHVFLVDEDQGTLAKLFKSHVARLAILVSNASKADAILIIPAGFTANLSHGLPAHIIVKVKANDVSMASLAVVGTIDRIVWSFNNIIISVLSSGKVNTTSLVDVRTLVMLSHRTLSLSTIQSIYNTMFMFVLAPLMVAGYTAVISAASIASEKEEKTLETLLTLPVSRTQIVIAKLAASLTVAVIGTISIGFGVYWYTIKTIGFASTSSKNLIELLGPEGLVAFLAATLTLLLLTCGIGLASGMLCQSVRGAQSIAGLMFMLVFVVGMPLLMMPLPSNPMDRLLVALTPFSAPVVVLKAMVLADNALLLATLASHVAYTLLSIVFVAKVVSSERLLLGWKLSWPRKHSGLQA